MDEILEIALKLQEVWDEFMLELRSLQIQTMSKQNAEATKLNILGNAVNHFAESLAVKLQADAYWLNYFPIPKTKESIKSDICELLLSHQYGNFVNKIKKGRKE